MAQAHKFSINFVLKRESNAILLTLSLLPHSLIHIKIPIRNAIYAQVKHQILLMATQIASYIFIAERKNWEAQQQQ